MGFPEPDFGLSTKFSVLLITSDMILYQSIQKTIDTKYFTVLDMLKVTKSALKKHRNNTHIGLYYETQELSGDFRSTLRD